MLLKFFYNDKLAHASYLVGCQKSGESIVIDPGRNIELYLQAAKKEGLKIIAAAETHIHADFVSGAAELAQRCKARLYLSIEGDETGKYCDTWQANRVPIHDGTVFRIGNVHFQAIHTQGHTSEHVSYLLTDDGAAYPMGIFTGDFVFVGDVGRPDLNEKAIGIIGSAEKNARRMFQSLQKFKQLPDFIQVWPSHGAGSACGKSLGAIPSSTVGYEKRFNWALTCEKEEEFIKQLLDGQPAPPKYFASMKRINKEGPKLLIQINRPQPQPAAFAREKITEYVCQGVDVVDTRPARQFAAGYIPGTINIPFGKSFTQWAGWLMDVERPVHLIADPAQLDEILLELYSIGIDRIESWFDLSFFQDDVHLYTYQEVIPSEIIDAVLKQKVHVIDVRHDDEWNKNRLPYAHHMMLGYLPDRLQEIPTNKPILLQCRTGYRSAIAASILQAHGIRDVINLLGGIEAWIKNDLPYEV